MGDDWSNCQDCLARIRRNDLYWLRGELEPLVSGVAVSVFNVDGEIAAALSLAEKTENLERVAEEKLRTLLNKVCEIIDAKIRELA